MPNNYSINRAVDTSCSTCVFNSLNSSGKNGIIIKNITGSAASITTIDKLRISTNSTGLEAIIFDDLVSQVLYPITLTGGEQMLTIPNYKTAEKAIYIYFQNQNVSVNAITCAASSGCGCNGTAKTNLPKNYAIAGLSNGVESSVQYGFLPCITTTCNFDYLICNLAKQNKNLVSYAMALSVHIDYLDRQMTSERLNKKTLNIGIDTIASYRDMQMAKFEEVIYGRLDGYGKTQRAGIKDIINDTLVGKIDSCVLCNATNYSSSPKL
jgi:hypothetical protein